jgi:predicted MFS family arabinose efflux permease
VVTSPRAPRGALFALSFGNFVIGTGTIIIAGLLNIMAADLDTTPAAIGQLLAAYGIAVCFGAPLLAGVTSHIERRTLLIAALVLFAAGHLLAAIAPDYASLVVLRFCTGFGAALLTPQAAATASLVAPQAERGRAIALVFLGFSLATVLGTPLGIALGAAFGWRVSLASIGVLAAGCALLLARRIPRGLYVPRIDAGAWGRVARDAALLLVLATSVLQAAGQFVLLSYLAAVFAAFVQAGPTLLALLFAWFGACGVAGNALAGALVDRIGADRVATLALGAMVLALACWPLTRGSLGFTVLATGLWGLGCFSVVSAQQTRLVALAPGQASISVALNSSSFYLGQAAGAAIGGMVLAGLGMALLSWIGALILLLALGTSSLARQSVRRRDARPLPLRRAGG